ncbi:MAG: hypothetical protein Ct9H90mP3_1800 [Flammeovirgaceae bacterium]|nr:MAG: hypothetical protein Ct9H90mP3_1800 [Flammeovirgaceae bacterium]
MKILKFIIVGDYLEHSRLYYFHNGGNPIIYSGSADVMIRSFKRRIESLFKINEEFIKKEAITILNYNLRDNCNSYELNEDGSYSKREKGKNKEFNLFKEFYLLDRNKVEESIIL